VGVSLADSVAGIDETMEIPLVALGLKETAPINVRAAFSAFLAHHYFEEISYFEGPLARIQVCVSTTDHRSVHNSYLRCYGNRRSGTESSSQPQMKPAAVSSWNIIML
jgi:hypothetical protein